MHVNKRLLIDIDDLTVQQGTETALDSISLCIHAGEFVGLIGPNGAGKTTLLRTLLGLLQPAKGVIQKDAARFSYIPQHGNLYNGTVPISVQEVVNLGSQGSHELAHEALGMVGIAHLARKRFSELSGGQRQRVTIAKALASNPDILILDEPTTGIDEATQAEFYDILHQLKKKGITIIMVAHEVDTVLKEVDRVVCINRKLLYDGSPTTFDASKLMPTFFEAQHHALHHDGGHHA